MRIVKVLNNSLVLAVDSTGYEIILMGKGIGYHKSIGGHLRSEEIEKVFVLKNKEISGNIIRLAAEVDGYYFELASLIIDHGKEIYQMNLLEHIYLSLTDHIAFTVKRVQSGVFIQNFYTMDLKRYHPAEFHVGEYAISLLNETLNAGLPEDEAGNIAFHFINARQDTPYNNKNLKINEVVKAILDIVRLNFGLIYKEEGISYSRFITHLRLFANRLVQGQLMSETGADSLYTQITESCQKEFACVKKIGKYVYGGYQIVLTNQEELYLTLHIHRVLEELVS